MINGMPEKLKALREKYGYSQKEVAKKLSVSASIVSAYESGERTPSTENLLALSYLYSCSVDYLLGKSTGNPSLMLDVTGLTDQQIRALFALIETMRNQ